MQVLTILSPDDQIAIGGIPPEAIAGYIGGPAEQSDPLVAPARISVNDFQPNAAFSAFMHQVIRTFGPRDPALQEAARQQHNGSVGIIDMRTREGPQGRVPVEDIVGIFAVEQGRLVAYYPNEKHALFTTDGLVQLPSSLREVHIRELKRLTVD